VSWLWNASFGGGRAASHDEALELLHDPGERHSEAEVFDSLGELSSRTPDSQQTLDYHRQAWPSPATSARPGKKHAPRRNRPLAPGGRHAREGTSHLQQALTVHQRIGTLAARLTVTFRYPPGCSRAPTRLIEDSCQVLRFAVASGGREGRTACQPASLA
jgi:hypothetical protein